MKQLRTKVLLSAFVLIFAIVATIGSTFAWFTVATTVNVSNMQLNVQSQDSLLIRLANANGTIKETTGDDNLFDATQYKTTLTTADILSYYFFDGRATAGGSAVPADAWRLEPVTVVQTGYAGIDGKIMSTLNANPNPTRSLTAITSTLTGNMGTDVNSKNGKVIQVSFFMFSQGEANREIVLQDLNIVAGGSGVSTEVEEAVRLSVWRSGYQNTSDAFVEETNHDALVFGYTKDYDYEFTSANPAYFFGTGIIPGAPYTGTTLNGFNKISDLTLGFNGTSSAPVTADWNSDYFNTLAAQDGGVSPKSSATTLFTLEKNVPTHVTVRIFVEGWAAYTTNNIIASNFSISYKFAIKAAV